jgi:hypothetical protein
MSGAHPPTSEHAARAQSALARSCSDFLKSCALLSWAALLGQPCALALLAWGGAGGAMGVACSFAALLAGCAALALGINAAFDAHVFASWAAELEAPDSGACASAPPGLLGRFDQALLALGLAKTISESPRPLDARARGATRLAAKLALAALFQWAMLAAAAGLAAG